MPVYVGVKNQDKDLSEFLIVITNKKVLICVFSINRYKICVWIGLINKINI